MESTYQYFYIKHVNNNTCVTTNGEDLKLQLFCSSNGKRESNLND